MRISLRDFYEAEATQKRFWGSYREIILAENILAEVTHGNGDKSLEVGIGDGFLFCQMHQLGYEVIGVDIAVKRCRNVQKTVPESEVIVADATALPLRNGTFNTVICSETLEHISGYPKAVAEAHRVLKISGQYIITVPFRQVLVKALCPHCLRSFYLDGHINSFDENGIMHLFNVAKFDVKKIFGFGSQIMYNKFHHFKLMRRLLDRVLYKVFNLANYIMCIGIKR